MLICTYRLRYNRLVYRLMVSIPISGAQLQRVARIVTFPSHLLDVPSPGKDVSPRPANAPSPGPRTSIPAIARLSIRFSGMCAALACCLLFALAASAQRVHSAAAPPPTASSPYPASNFVIVIDAAHGGTDIGAKLSPTLDEKNVTLALAQHLRSLLAAHGISVVVTRTTDANPPMDTRADIANHAHAAACLILHATTSGIGIHLFTSSLSPAPPTAAPPSPALTWSTAQAAYVNQSIRLSSDIDAAFTHTTIPVIVGRTFLQPLDNLTCPALAIELAPKPSSGLSSAKSVDNPGYQSLALNSIVAGILQWQQDWTPQS